MGQNRTSRAASAHKAAMAHVDTLIEASQELRAIPQIDHMVEAMMRGVLTPWSVEDQLRYDQATLNRAGDLVGEIAACDLWRRNGRVVYDLHTELADALYRSATTRVPSTLFDRLPHINPMIVIPDPWPAGNSKGGISEGYVRCIFVVGHSGRGLCDSNDPDRDGLALLFCYDRVDEETGKMVAGQFRDLIPLPMHRESFTAGEAIDFAEEWQGGSDDPRARREAIKAFRPRLEKAFSILTYLCTDNRDVEAPPEWVQSSRKKTGKNRKLADRDPFWVRVGWYVGPQLHTARQRAAAVDRDGISIPSGTEHGPQHRAGHFKTVRIGPGKPNERTQTTTVWVEPYWTKLEDLPKDQDPPTQIVPVDAQRKDPLRRRKTIGR